MNPLCLFVEANKPLQATRCNNTDVARLIHFVHLPYLPSLVGLVGLHDTQAIQPKVGCTSCQGDCARVAQDLNSYRIRIFCPLDGEGIDNDTLVKFVSSPDVGNGGIWDCWKLRIFVNDDSKVINETGAIDQAVPAGCTTRGYVQVFRLLVYTVMRIE